MSETDPGPLPTSKIQLAVTVINGSPYAPTHPYSSGDHEFYHLLPTLLSSCKISSTSNNSPQPLISLCI